MSLSTADSDKLLDLGKRYCMLNIALEKHFWRTESRKLFQSQTFKHHWMLHSLALAKGINPRHTWCYSGELYEQLQDAFEIMSKGTWASLKPAQLHGEICFGSVCREKCP